MKTLSDYLRFITKLPILVLLIFAVCEVSYGIEDGRQSPTAKKLTSIAGDSLDSFKMIELELTRAEAIIRSTTESHNRLMDHKRRGVVYGKKIREVEKQQLQAQAVAGVLAEAHQFFDSNLEPVWAGWAQNLAKTGKATNVVLVPGVSFEIGGHIAFNRSAELSETSLGQGRQYLESYLSKSSNSSPWELQLTSARMLRESLRMRAHVSQSDLNLLNGQVFETGYQIESRMIENNRMTRDLNRIDRVLANPGELQMPHLSTVVPGLGTGWRHPLPIDIDAIKETLPLAISKSQARGKFNSAWINVVASAKQLKELHESQRKGRKVAEERIAEARESLLVNRSKFLTARKELEIYWDEMNLLATLAGIDAEELTLMSANIDTHLADFSARELVMACKDSPVDFCGAARIYTEIARAEGNAKSVEIEVEYLYNEQQRLAKSRYFKEADLRNATFRHEAAREYLRQAREELREKQLELRQWTIVQNLQRDRDYESWDYVIQPTLMAKARKISKKREELGQLNLRHQSIMSDISQLPLTASSDGAIRRFESALARGIVGELDQSTLHGLLAQLKVERSSSEIISQEVENALVKHKLEASKLAVAD